MSQRKKDQDARKTQLDQRETVLDAEAKDPTRKSNLDTREAALDARQTVLNTREAGLNSRERQPGFAGFSQLESVQLSSRLIGAASNESEPYILNTILEKVAHHAIEVHLGTKLKIIEVTPEISNGNIAYDIDVYSRSEVGTSKRNNFIFDSTHATLEIDIGKNDYSATNLDLELSIDNRFSAKIIKAEADDFTSKHEDGSFYAEVATDYSGSNTSDYSTWGFWFKVPNQTINTKFYDLAAFARPNSPGNVTAGLTGTATYTGGMLGLHTLEKNGTVQLKRLTGTATITADFGSSSERGSINATFNQFKLDGQDVGGRITFLANTFTSDYYNSGASTTAIIDGVTYGKSAFTIGFAGAAGSEPTGMIGTLTGANRDSSGDRAFIAAYGTRKTE